MRKALSSLLIVISMGVNAQTTLALSGVTSLSLTPTVEVKIDTSYGILEFWTLGNEKPEKRVFDGYQVKKTTTYYGSRSSFIAIKSASYFIGTRAIPLNTSKWYLFIPYDQFQE